MEDILNNETEVESIKTRIVENLSSINQIISSLNKQIDPSLFDTVREFEQNMQSEINNESNLRTETSTTADIDEIDEFFQNFKYDDVQPVNEKPTGKSKKLTRAQSVHPNPGKTLCESQHTSGSLQSLTSSNSMLSTMSQQNLNFDANHSEIDRTALKKITQIKLTDQFEEDISTDYNSKLDHFRNSCIKLDQFLEQLKIPKEENIKTLTVNPEAIQLTAELNKAIKNVISILQVDLNQANNIFDCDGDPFPLYDVLTELYQLL